MRKFLVENFKSRPRWNRKAHKPEHETFTENLEHRKWNMAK